MLFSINKKMNKKGEEEMNDLTHPHKMRMRMRMRMKGSRGRHAQQRVPPGLVGDELHNHKASGYCGLGEG